MVRKREWVTSKGEHKESWIADYADQGGTRHIKTFSRKRDADAFAFTTMLRSGKGHTLLRQRDDHKGR